ncbi:MAG: dTDP-4-dehydrorhamnose 3,5-epimerase [Bacteroidales bacterium]
MEIIKTPIEGLLVVKPAVYYDGRGYFFESYNEKRFKENGITDIFVQDNQSLSQQGVVRGLHFQCPPYEQAKLVRVIQGSVLDVAVDIRKKSPTYGKYFSIVLSADNFLQFYIPAGFAHGFVALEENTIFAYKCSQFYNKASEDSIRYDDPLLNIDWKIKASVISDKDLIGHYFKDFISKF